jgi:argininosuccinate lyase
MIRNGRFSQQAAERALRYGESVSFDWRLYRHDIAGSIAHAAALAKAGIVTADEQEKIDDGLRTIEQALHARRQFAAEDGGRYSSPRETKQSRARWRRVGNNFE